MGIQERRTRQKENLRQEILDAAREMFVEEGYDSVSMRKIAERIEYSPTTIYLHFKDKADLFNQLCEETFAKLAERLGALQRRHTDDPLAYLREGLRVYIDFGLKHPNHYTVAFILHPQESCDYNFEDSIGKRAFDYLRTAVMVCVEMKKFRHLDVDTTAQALWAAVHGVTALLIVHTDFPFVAKNRLIDHTIDTMIRGLQS
ncbi:MAG: TetR/AcrR family transcriptional regulator [Pyrinomonadaceae bacterium]|nr:TetR/AcrR family transcriptional regulator [Pyrinomonadaceae bacterium]